MKPLIKIHRHWQDMNQTSGTITILDSLNFPLYASLGLERGWFGNLPNISCIPLGAYKVVLEWSATFETMLWEIKGVPGRAECKFHSANYFNELKGCIAPGLRYKYINDDGYRDVTNSNNSLRAFHEALKPYTEALLVITGDKGIH
jgi:hypothetical protein